MNPDPGTVARQTRRALRQALDQVPLGHRILSFAKAVHGAYTKALRSDLPIPWQDVIAALKVLDADGWSFDPESQALRLTLAGQEWAIRPDGRGRTFLQRFRPEMEVVGRYMDPIEALMRAIGLSYVKPEQVMVARPVTPVRLDLGRCKAEGPWLEALADFHHPYGIHFVEDVLHSRRTLMEQPIFPWIGFLKEPPPQGATRPSINKLLRHNFYCQGLLCYQNDRHAWENLVPNSLPVLGISHLTNAEIRQAFTSSSLAERIAPAKGPRYLFLAAGENDLSASERFRRLEQNRGVWRPFDDHRGSFLTYPYRNSVERFGGIEQAIEHIFSWYTGAHCLLGDLQPKDIQALGNSVDRIVLLSPSEQSVAWPGLEAKFSGPWQSKTLEIEAKAAAMGENDQRIQDWITGRS